MSTFGFCFYGPALHFWYKGLERYVPGSSVGRVATKVFLDQTIFASCFTFSFFTLMGFMEGKTWHDIKKKTRKRVCKHYQNELVSMGTCKHYQFWACSCIT